MPDEIVALAQRLISYETCDPEGISEAAGFVKGWLEARGIEAQQDEVRGLPVVKAEVGPEGAPTVVLHGHLDVVPAFPDQFEPKVEGDRLYGRGTYDMKGAIAAMLLVTAAMREQDRVRVRLGIVGDEESEEESERGSDHLVDTGFTGDFAITGEPTDLHIGIEAKGVLALRLEVEGTAAHGATPWLGENAVLNAIDVFRSIESLPFARHSSELFDRPSINLGRIVGGDALNKVPDRCVIDVDIRYLPDQDPAEILAQVREIPGATAAAL
nr:M20/M25/M40 family metallo-hydrolase [Actinomycetota bacterium]